MSTVPRLYATCKCTKSVERFWFCDSRLHVSYWWSLGLCFCLQHLHSTFLKGHSAGLQEQSLKHIAHCGCTKSTERFCASRCPALGSPSSKDLLLGRAHTPPSGQPRGRMISQIAEALEPEVPVAAQRQQRDSSSSTGPLQATSNFDKFNLLSQIWDAPDHS